MNLPYVIDNREHTLADVLNRLLSHGNVHVLDVATAYFNIGGFDLLRESVLVRLYRGGFLHAKAYLSFADRTVGDRFTPVAGIVGSSNFTRAGLTTNQEINLTHKAIPTP